ncbi:hypothetical protein Pint_03605 [Pistacia integerrima]|uniref:Uncharacterized protein n=1 Tax=Pistacia integerrima TaxID=434235 RepID=A0ACC0Z072_9ROSI|nr:hypothetical protein Pint_03605 [Pistacia integerrima]
MQMQNFVRSFECHANSDEYCFLRGWEQPPPQEYEKPF